MAIREVKTENRAPCCLCPYDGECEPGHINCPECEQDLREFHVREHEKYPPPAKRPVMTKTEFSLWVLLWIVVMLGAIKWWHY